MEITTEIDEKPLLYSEENSIMKTWLMKGLTADEINIYSI